MLQKNVGWVDVRKPNTSIYVELLKFMLGFAKPQPNLHLMYYFSCVNPLRKIIYLLHEVVFMQIIYILLFSMNVL